MGIKKNKSPVQAVFRAPFLVGKISIPKKDVEGYIRGKSIPIIGDDYHYSFAYEKGVLTWLSCATDEWDKGKSHIFMSALTSPGKWQYEDGGVWYFLDSTGDIPNLEIDYHPRPGHEDATSAYVVGVPSLQWSNSKRNIPLEAIMGIVLIISIVILYRTMGEYSRAAQATKPPPVVVHKKNTTGEFIYFLQSVSQGIGTKGIIERIEMQGDKPQAHIKFDQEYDAKQWVTTKGGRYENGKVVYSSDSVGPH